MKTTVDNGLIHQTYSASVVKDGTVVIIVEYQGHPELAGKPCVKTNDVLNYLFETKDGATHTSYLGVKVRLLDKGERIILEGE